MRIDCQVIHDLLPLYTDNVCSNESRTLVDEHLQECPACREMLHKIRETELDDSLKNEKTSVIQYGARRFRSRSAAIGSVISGLFMIPILVLLIINITSGASLGSFFVVMASLYVAASLIIVPLMMPRDRAFWTFCSFTISLIILLAVVCIYSRGNWFWIASSAVLFGLGAVFLPFLVKAEPVKKKIGTSNPLIIILGLDAALFINMMNMIRSHGRITGSTILYALGVIAGIGFVVTEILRNRGKENEEK